MAMSISSAVMPAWPYAIGALCAPAVVVMSPPFSRYFVASPVPRIQTGGLAMSCATSGETMTSAPPPSLTMQHSRRCSGSAMTRESSTSSMVISLTGWTAPNSRSFIACTASGLRIACARVTTESSAKASSGVPYSCMCRIFTMA